MKELEHILKQKRNLDAENTFNCFSYNVDKFLLSIFHDLLDIDITLWKLRKFADLRCNTVSIRDSLLFFK